MFSFIRKVLAIASGSRGDALRDAPQLRQSQIQYKHALAAIRRAECDYQEAVEKYRKAALILDLMDTRYGY